MIRTALILTVFIAAPIVGATEVVLRDRAVPQSSIVRLSDVATVSGGDALSAEHFASTPLMPAPPQGAPLYLRCTELRDLLAARGVDVRQLQFSGAEVVAIELGQSPVAPVQAPTAVPRPKAAALDDAVFETTAQQLTTAVVEHVRKQTGHDLWKVQVDADDDVIAAFAAAGQSAVSGGKAPWTGRQRFVIAGGPDAKAVVAYARVERLEMAAVALRSIARGELVRRTDVELQPVTGALPKQAITTLESLVGREAVQGIQTGSLVLNNQVRSPLLVHRGERVSVRVRAAGVTIRTYAIAQQDGSIGELVTVQSAESKEKYAAQVAGVRELEILAAGASATEVAANPTTATR